MAIGVAAEIEASDINARGELRHSRAIIIEIARKATANTIERPVKNGAATIAIPIKDARKIDLERLSLKYGEDALYWLFVWLYITRANFFAPNILTQSFEPPHLRNNLSTNITHLA